MDEQEKFKLEDFVEIIKGYRARHTELITVYVPKDLDINIITKQLESEKSTAANIKSTSTRKNVQDALESLIRVCKQMKRAPKNGVALFAGNVSQVEGQADFITEVFEPPEELNIRLYRCDQTFVVDPLEEMLEVKEVYGLIVIERKEATLGLLIGKKIKMLKHVDSFVPGKVRAGGQCLSPSSLIVTKKGIKRIEDVKVGDELKSLNIKDNKIIFTKCINKWKKEKEDYKQIILRDCWSIISSKDHTFFIEKNNKIIETTADKLSKNDSLITYYDTEQKVNPHLQVMDKALALSFSPVSQNKSIFQSYNKLLKCFYFPKPLQTHTFRCGYKTEGFGDNQINAIEIKDIINIKEKIELIDIETENENFFANGILVHNSSQRYHRITEGLAKDFYRKIADIAKSEFFYLKNLKGILLGGPGPTKEDFLKEGQLITALVDKVLAVKDIGYADEHGLELLVEVSQDVLAGQEIVHEQKILEKFFNMLGKERDKTAYGREDVEKALEYGAVDTLFLSRKLKKTEIKELEKKAAETSVKVELISTDLDEGMQFWNLSGIGAILRFKIA